MANTAWNPSDKTAACALTNSNLTATYSNTNQGVRAADKQVSGKYYFEVTLTTLAANAIVGVGLSYANLANLAGTAAGTTVIIGASGQVFLGAAGTAVTLGARANGDVIGVAVDIDNKLIWFRVAPSGNWNGNASFSPGGTGGVSFVTLGGAGFPFYPITGSSSWPAASTANFGDSAFSGAVPSGYTSGFPTGSPATNTVATQTSVEHFIAPNPQAQVTQVAVEHFIALSPYLQATQVALEEWAAPNPAAQVTQVALEEWATVALSTFVSGAGEVDAGAAVTGVGAATAAGVGEADAAAVVTGVGVAYVPPGVGRGEADAAAVVTGAGAAIPVVTGAGEVDAGAAVIGAGFVGAIGAGEVDAFADVRGMGAVVAPPNALPFLPGLGWSVHRRPTFDTIVAPHASGAEVRLALWQNCLWEFELTYDALASNAAYPGVWTNTLQTLMGFYLARGGARGTFLFIDPDFNSMTDQGIGAGDGMTVAFSFVRTFGGQVEPVGWVTAVAAVYLAGAPVTSGWTVSGNTITFATPPASGVVVSADFSYGFVCRFLEDTIDFEEFMDNLWQLKSLKFRQVRL